MISPVNKTTPLLLIILDGFGYRAQKEYNAIAHAHTPTLDYLTTHYPHTLLHASGTAVGLPAGYMGNSQAGHETIGSGRIVPQDITRIFDMMQDKTFFSNNVLNHALDTLKISGGRLHILGLLSDAGIHSHIQHLYAFIHAAQQHHIKDIYLHLFLDGRDTPPESAQSFIDEIQQRYPNVPIGSLHGRFYAMDRDDNWQRTKKTLDVLTTIQPSVAHATIEELLLDAYAHNVTDEFFPPTQLVPNSVIRDHDGVILFNVRPDRMQQLIQLLAKKTDVIPTDTVPNLTFFLTAHDMLKPLDITHTLKEVLNLHKKSMYSIAETEKYAHVTYFFDAKHHRSFTYETQVLVPSIVTQTYAPYPRMSANEITQQICASLEHDPHDVYIINYANADMVGHSGDFAATVRAIECLDQQLAILYKFIKKMEQGTMLITADHGNAELMFDDVHHQPHTAHTTNPVPFIVVNTTHDIPDLNTMAALYDIAPYILACLHLDVPDEMKQPTYY